MSASRRPTPRRWGLRLSAGLSGLLLLLAGTGHVLMNSLGSGITKVEAFDGLDDRPGDSRGLNFLVVGVDRRDNVDGVAKARYKLGGAPCNCTDTLMLVHVSGDRSRASVVSIPRDTYVEFPAHTNSSLGEKLSAHGGKLNSAYAHGGPPLTVRSVEKLSGVHIDHYLEIDFTSFMKTVDVIGGVNVCTARPLKDAYSGLDIPAGSSKLNGGEALQYVRARYVDGSADISRMQRQQRFLAAVIDKVTSTGGLMNPVRFRKVSGTVLDSIRADSGFNAGSLVALGRAMQDFSPRSSEFTTVPIADGKHKVEGLGETVLWDKERAEKLFAKIRDDEPIAVPRKKPKSKAIPVEVTPGQVRVTVLNGTGEPGLAGRVDQALAKSGFDTSGTAQNAKGGDVQPHTVIAYDPGWDRSARALAAALPGAKLKPVPGQGQVMQVTLGKDFSKVRKVRAADPVLDGAEVWGEFAAVTGDEVVCA